MIIDKLNLIFTIISIVATIFSICYAKKSKQYKEEAKEVVSFFNLFKLYEDFKSKSSMFLNNTRSKNWYKGKDAQSIISPFRDSLLSFAELYPLMQKEDANNLKNKVNKLHKIVQKYEISKQKEKDEACELIFDINNIFYAEIDKIYKSL